MEGEQLNLFSEAQQNSENYFTRKRSWSAVKHRILLRYIQAYCYNLGGSHQYVNYVDGFAGTGQYTEGIGIEDFIENSRFWASKYKSEFLDTDGSPLIALKCSKLFSQENRTNLRCFFVELDLDRNQKLLENCKKFGNVLTYKVYDPQAFGEALPQVLEDIGKYPTLFFLDTFGVKGVTFEQICSIGNHVKKYKGELFILFHNIQVARHAGQSTVVESAKSSARKAAKTYSQNLTALLGKNSDIDWEPKWRELKSKPQEFERWALEYFKKKLRLESGFRGVTSFEIKEKHSDVRPQYSIVVGSNHPEKAFGEFLNEFVWQENKLLFYQEDKDKTSKNFLDKEWSKQQESRIEEVKPQIIELLEDLYPQWLSFKEVITQIILSRNELGFLSRTQYYNNILASLYEEGKLEIRDPGKKKAFTLDSLLRISH